MAVSYEAEGVSFPKIKRRETTKWIKHVAEIYNRRVANITYIFCSDEEILRINNAYLNHDYYTDIITFDYSEENCISGDLFISLDTVKSNAEKFNADYNEELHRVIIHGVLHLCGFKDKTEKEEKQMRKREEEALSLLKNNENKEEVHNV